jgi:hypothetical protein
VQQSDLVGALEPARQAANQWRALAKEDPSNFLPELARSLDALCMLLTKLEMDGHALAAISESVTHWRQLAGVSLERSGPGLALALKRLAAHTLKLYPRDFLSLREEATDVLVRLAAINPKFLRDAAQESSRMAVNFSGSGMPKKAVQHGRQAVEYWRSLAAEDIVQHGGQLVLALRQLAVDQTSPDGVADKSLQKEARRIVVSRTVRLLFASSRPKALGAMFTAAVSGMALRPGRSASHHRARSR